MKKITIKLAETLGTEPMHAWPAFEVPDTAGTLAVHKAAWGGWQEHASRWSITHIASGRSLPAPFWLGEYAAVWYAHEFYDKARSLGIDLASPEPIDGVPKDVQTQLREVFSRTPPESVEHHEKRIVRCRSCKAPIVWLKTAKDKPMPVNADSVHPGDMALELGKHVSHFATCPDANTHRKPR